MKKTIEETTRLLLQGTLTKDEADKILLDLHNVSKRSELLIALKDCRKWMINKGVNIESEFFKKIDEAINCC